MAVDLSIREASSKSQVTVDASTTTFLAGNLLAYNGSAWVKADADSATVQIPRWVCLNSVEAGGSSTYTMPVARRVVMVDVDAPYTADGLLFLSATAGAVTHTNPTAAAGTVQRCVGWALSTSEVVIDLEIPHYFVTLNMAGTVPATASNYEHFYTATRPLRVIGAVESHRTAGSDGSAVTLDVFKSASGGALNSGATVLATTFNLKSTADTPVAVGPSATASAARLATGDRLEASDAGTLTAVAGLTLTVVMIEEN